MSAEGTRGRSAAAKAPATRKATTTRTSAKGVSSSKAKAKKAAPSSPRARRAKKPGPEEVQRTLDRLAAIHPDAHCELVHADPFQLIVATVLSAQTTDVAVNKVTPALFAKYRDAEALAAAEPIDVEGLISTIGMFRQKSKNIVGLARKLVAEHGGSVPRSLAQLVASVHPVSGNRAID